MPYEPCPHCGKQPEKLAKAVARLVAPLARTACLACWPCNVIAECGDGQRAMGGWVSLGPGADKHDRLTPSGRTKARGDRRRKQAPPVVWRRYSPHHWQCDLAGQVLDYWPTKRKWRWNGKTEVGDVGRFIRERARGDRSGWREMVARAK